MSRASGKTKVEKDTNAKKELRQYYALLLNAVCILFNFILYSYFMPFCSKVKTITPRCSGRPDDYYTRPSAKVHQVVHSTEG